MASPSARNTLGTDSKASAARAISRRISSGLRARNFFWGWVYISQKVHWFHEQPLVTGRISDFASLGGRNTGSTYSMGKLYIASQQNSGKVCEGKIRAETGLSSLRNRGPLPAYPATQPGRS